MALPVDRTRGVQIDDRHFTIIDSEFFFDICRKAGLTIIDMVARCPECHGSGISMQPGMPDGEPEGLPCRTCSTSIKACDES